MRLPEIVFSPASYGLVTVAETVIGSVVLASSSPTAFLYTNALPSPVVTVFDHSLASPEPASILLHAPVQAILPTADGVHAVVTHHSLGAGSSYPTAFSVVPVAAELPSKIVGLDAPPVSIALAPDGQHALVATGDAANPAYRLDVAHMPSLQMESRRPTTRPTQITTGPTSAVLVPPSSRVAAAKLDTALLMSRGSASRSRDPTPSAGCCRSRDPTQDTQSLLQERPRLTLPLDSA